MHFGALLIVVCTKNALLYNGILLRFSKKICESVILARMMIFDNKRLISSRVYKGLFWRSIPAVSSQNYFVEYYHAGISQDFRI